MVFPKYNLRNNLNPLIVSLEEEKNNVANICFTILPPYQFLGVYIRF